MGVGKDGGVLEMLRGSSREFIIKMVIFDRFFKIVFKIYWIGSILKLGVFFKGG